MEQTQTTFLVTGAAGHLGSVLVRRLQRLGADWRGLVLPGQNVGGRPGFVEGDVTAPASLEALFDGLAGRRVIVIHTAGIVDISGLRGAEMQRVNVGGTANVIALCQAHPGTRLVYVSSVHAIPERGTHGPLCETREFAPERVIGDYAKTKAAATAAVLAAADAGLDAVVVHPSGILGPNSPGGNHLVQLVADYLGGRLPACVDGGYDFVDVRDVADGCIAAALRGRSGECYILSGRYAHISTLLQLVRGAGGGHRLPELPVWLAGAAAPLLSSLAKRRGERPLYTRYSLYTLVSNGRFCHDKATRELGYHPRGLWRTVRDTVRWLQRSTLSAGESGL